MRTVVTISSCDKYYFEQAQVFLKSIKANTDENVCIGLINSKDRHENAVHDIDSSIKIIKLNLDKPTRFGHAKIRFELIRQILLMEYTEIIWMDCDVIVRDSIKSIWKGIEPNTLKVVRRNRELDRVKFQIGVFGLGNSLATRNYIIDVKNKLNDIETWCDDQTVMYRVYKKHKKHISIVRLNKRYNDSKFKNESVIWHCKSSHFNEEKYQREYKKYL